jgi:hypothetical protein
MLPRIVKPRDLRAYRFSGRDHCRVTLLSDPADPINDESGGTSAPTVFLKEHDPCDRVAPHPHHHAAELLFVLRG